MPWKAASHVSVQVRPKGPRTNSRVHPNYKTKDRVTNWAEFDQTLVERGNITIWISPDALNARAPKPSGRRGALQKYTDIAIETALTLRLVFRLPLRQPEAFLRSLLDLRGLALEAPDHTTFSLRSKSLSQKLVPVVSKKPVHLIIDQYRPVDRRPRRMGPCQAWRARKTRLAQIAHWR